MKTVLIAPSRRLRLVSLAALLLLVALDCRPSLSDTLRVLPTPSDPVEGAPTGLTLASTTLPLTLSWQPGVSDPPYTVQWLLRREITADQNGLTRWTRLAELEADANAYVDPTIEAGKYYRYRIRPVRSDGTRGPLSNKLDVTMTDDDTVGVTVTPVALSVSEAGGSATYTLRLDGEPTGTVTITPSSGDPTVATVSPSQLAFGPGTWQTLQTVTVTGVNDAIDNVGDARRTTVRHVIAGGGYDSVTVADVVVTVTDDDTVGVTVAPIALSVSEAGGSATYTLRLDSEPTGDVTITPSSGDPTVATVSPSQLEFSPGTWQTLQTVT